jgi:hypothetical protein
MRLDTNTKSVYFEEGTLLTLDDLELLVRTLTFLDETVKDEDIPLRVPDPATLVVAEHLTRSDSDSSHLYKVTRYADGRMTCDCPDYVIRRSKTGGQCKHVVRVRYRYY